MSQSYNTNPFGTQQDMGDDGTMGCRTPDIDRSAKEGGNFTDPYGQRSCTAGRAAVVTGQWPAASPA
jgi:arylsulfatase A-like enzyme